MSDSCFPRQRLSGLKPDALMAQGLLADEAVVEVNGIEIEAPLGRGGMGAVYLGRQLSLDRHVAVKVLARELADNPQFLERMEREARVMARLRHANIVAVHDFQRTEDGAAIVMEFVKGGTLREKLQQHPNGLPVDEALSILRQIAAGLEAAHHSGVIHRDMKPENVLIDSDGTARVTDFGLALPLHEANRRLTIPGSTMGTVDYMAPEQLRGAEVDVRLDVFAIGVVAYELLTGRTPRGSFDPPHRLRADIPAHISDAVLRALRPDRSERFQNVRAFMLALHGRRRLTWPWVLGGIVSVMGVIGAFWQGTGKTGTQFGPWRDAIAGTRIYEDVISGDWKNEDGILTSNEQICILKLEEELPESYDVRMQFTRLAGTDSIALFFRANESTGAAELDAWREGLAGVQSIGSDDLRRGYGFRFPLTSGRSYELHIEVRPDLVRMKIDGVLMKEFHLEGKRIFPPGPWEWDSMAKPAALAVGSYQSATRFEKVEWRPVHASSP